MAKNPKPRRRLEADVARALILDAAEKRLVHVGPGGIRLQEVAADAKVSHPTVLHHFGSREGLVKAVCARALQRINASLVEAIAASTGEDEQLEAILQNVASSFERSGHARVLLWLALEGQRIDKAEAHLSDVVDAAHALRISRRHGKKKPSRDDTGFAIVLGALALVGGAILATPMLENAGVGGDVRAFRSWLARLLIQHLDS